MRQYVVSSSAVALYKLRKSAMGLYSATSKLTKDTPSQRSSSYKRMKKEASQSSRGNSSHPLPTPLPRTALQDGRQPEKRKATQVKQQTYQTKVQPRKPNHKHILSFQDVPTQPITRRATASDWAHCRNLYNQSFLSVVFYNFQLRSMVSERRDMDRVEADCRQA